MPMPETAQPYYRQGTDVLNAATNLGLLIKNVSASLHLAINQRVAPLGLTAMQWRPLIMLRYHNARTPAEIARLMNIDTGAMTRTLDRLEAKGFLLRQRCDEDRRLVLLELTPEGHEVSGKILPEIAQSMNEHLDGFSAAEIDTLFSMLHRVIDNGRKATEGKTQPD